jgi:excisionase family DNA binding protein
LQAHTVKHVEPCLIFAVLWLQFLATRFDKVIKMIQEPLLTVAEAANLLGVGKSTIRLWAINGKLRAVRVAGRMIRVPQSEIERLMSGFVEEEIAPTAAIQSPDEVQDGDIYTRIGKLIVDALEQRQVLGAMR